MGVKYLKIIVSIYTMESVMTLESIKKKAAAIGITAGKMNKTDLIRQIQAKEGNFPCYLTAIGGCDQAECVWRADCLK